ncbi:MAG: protoheme IX farnesyltransferase [Ardenticatenia bacterium]|nr:protoheme IX farnesyltransferase [Ardenticatenia bacterium]
MTIGEPLAVPETDGPVTGVRSEAGKGNVLLGLTRPRLGVLGMITVLFCNLLAYTTPGPPPRLLGLTGLIVGGALALAGASALNQFLERRPDALMRRTAGRPLPTGRISPRAAGLIGLLLTAGGLAVLAASVGLSTAGWTLAGVLSYSLVYTPLKQRSSLNTIVGAFPGAIPALMGWSAARALTPDAWVIFGVLALWQVPHFLAIAWLYRADYQRAGFQMLGGGPANGADLGRQSLLFALAILPCSLLLLQRGYAGPVYGVGALALGLYYVSASRRLQLEPSPLHARRLLRASVVFLPLFFIVLVLDRLLFAP